MRLFPLLPPVVFAAAVAFAAALSVPAGAQGTPDWSHAQSVTVTLSSFSFDPAALRLPHGEAITLHLVNSGGGGHNFSAPEFFAAASVNPEDAGKIVRGAIEVPGHQSVDIRLVPAAGHFALRCTHTLHASFGMRGDITVE
jgi:uncharacterized cupredoxin-like copper-binding protein